MRRPRLLEFETGLGGMRATVRRQDERIVQCTVEIAGDGTLCLKPPKGEWLHEPPPAPLEGQTSFEDD